MIRFLNRHPVGCLFILVQFAIYGLGTTILWYTVGTLSGREKGTGMFTENTVWKAVERLINANADNDSDGLSPYESGYINGYNDALVDLLNALNIEHDFHHFD